MPSTASSGLENVLLPKEFKKYTAIIIFEIPPEACYKAEKIGNIFCNRKPNSIAQSENFTN